MALKAGNEVVGGNTLRRAAIQSPNFVTGVSGWSINQDGSAEFNNVVIRNGQVVSGTALFYSGPPALGNLVASISAAAGTDAKGNAYLAGVASYQPGGTFVASQVNAGTFSLLTAPGAGGPYTLAASMTLSGGLLLQAVAATITAQEQFIAQAGIDITSGGLVIGGGGANITGGETTDTLTVSGHANPPLIISGATAGNLLELVNSTVGAAAQLTLTTAAAGDAFLNCKVAGDTNTRLLIDTTAGGLLRFRLGPGVTAVDTTIERLSANLLGLVQTDLAIDTAGRGLQVKEGANAKQGTAILAAGSVVVANTAVTANSRIFLGFVTPSANAGALFCSSVTVGTGFTIKSTNAADTSTVAYEIFEAAP